MNEEFNLLRRELRTDFEVMAARQGLMAREMDRMADRAAASEEAAQKAAEAAQKASGDTRKIGREVADHLRWVEGRFRLMNERFERFFDAIEGEQGDLRTQVQQIDQRVLRLESQQPPAA